MTPLQKLFSFSVYYLENLNEMCEWWLGLMLFQENQTVLWTQINSTSCKVYIIKQKHYCLKKFVYKFRKWLFLFRFIFVLFLRQTTWPNYSTNDVVVNIKHKVAYPILHNIPICNINKGVYEDFSWNYGRRWHIDN